ncbi:multidrug effflux MFS transporter [Photobacterium sanctipauli]|uniref:multidrug effflux MFS transporter n=1 Tax=Photobacterium sanctipauli TaxID=1342794 RepID=UPI00056D65AA|nr:multidrug effflux MFS transporter [Photobacterium sanctipauli]
MPKKDKYIGYLILLVVFWPLAVDIYLPAFPDIGIALSASAKQLKDTVTFFAVGFGVGQLLLGNLIDRYGRRPIALIGVAFYLLCSLAQMFISTIEALTLLRVFQGVAAAATATTVIAIAKDVYDDKAMPKMLSILNGVVCCVPALAPVLGALLTELLGYKATFAFMAGYALLGFFLLLFGLPETGRQQKQAANVSSYIAILSDRHFLFYASITMCSMAVIISYVSSSPIWLLDTLSLSMREFSFWFSVNAVVSITGGLFIATYLIGKLGTERTLVVGLCLIAASGIVMLNAQETAFDFMLPIFINAAGSSLVLGTSSSKALSRISHNTGAASALLGFIQMAGAGLLVSLIQNLALEIPTQLSAHMFMLIPALLMLTVIKRSVAQQSLS